MSITSNVRLSSPIYLRLNTAPFAQTILSVREHLLPQVVERPGQPLILLTFHPGYLAGSYEDRDYFERLTPLLFQWTQDCCRLRIFTVNHPGYDQPRHAVIDRFNLQPYSIRHQPLAMGAALSWLFNTRLAQDEQIVWIAYGHSMGGLALSQFQPAELVNLLARNGRSLYFAKILSAPALCVHPQARDLVGRLDVLHTLKLTAGRLPFYAPVATGLYQAFAPLFYRREATRFSIDALSEFGSFRSGGFRRSDFHRLDPFLLLEQGRELLRFRAMAAGGPDLLADAHIILAQQDGMIDLPATEALIEAARQEGHRVTRHDIDSTHLLELDAAEIVARVIWQVIRETVERSLT